ncbi:MAG TPA: PEGA domain-containing protein [Kofleriaceae bacterium]|nr:PEGA domain-containing protein [Kofleriaceae bacterium]
MRGFSIATKCANVAELIEKFRDRVDEESILVTTVESRDIGTECAFAILLADKKVGLAGTCVVRDVFTDPNNPFKRPGMRLQIKRLGPESQKVWTELVAKRISPRKMTQALPVIAMPSMPGKKPRVATIPPVGDRPSSPALTAKPPVIAPPVAARPVVAPPVAAAKPVVVAPPVVAKPPETAPPVAAKSPEVPPVVAKPPEAAPPVVAKSPEAPPVVAPKPVIVMPRAKGRNTGEMLDVVADAPTRRPPTPTPQRVRDDSQEPLARAPRATPFDLDNLAKHSPAVFDAKQPDLTTPDAKNLDEQEAERKAEAKKLEAKQAAAKPVEGTRTPGSPYVLPANPLANIADSSLEGYVDVRLTEAFGGDAPAAFPQGTLDDPPVEPEPPMVLAPPPPIDEIAVILARPPVDEVPVTGSGRARPASVTAPLKPMITAKPPTRTQAPTKRDAPVAGVRERHSEPLPLPPPPALPPMAATTPLPYAATKLPNLNVPDANDRVRGPLLKRRVRNQLLLAVLLVPLLGAGAMVAYMQLATAPAATVTPLAPAATPPLDEPLTTSVPVEPAPPAPAIADPAPTLPTRPQPIHAVLVRTAPIAARVTVNGRSFGTTPTYVKIPANTPVELVIARPGFKPVKYPFTSKTATDRVFVRLERARGGR